ncbi:MAG: tryptophan--tRNA ligase [Polaromonas sp.]|nr:tryptophan--tRNA ligase [Polaromonas sp.]
MSANPTQRFLTGITTTGTPHLGNYVGSIRPAVAASQRADVQSFYFLADYHALVKCDDPVRIQRSTLEIAASWLAAGLDPERVTFYRQSDIPEIPELTWLLTCVTGKGLLNRAHAYKASVDKNQAAGHDPDADINAGLFMYPVLMAADILMFKAHKVPVGRDQIQHIEMARDIALRFNHLFGEHLLAPEAVVDASVALLPGLDGRKMSKSYDNTIALFAPAAVLRKQVAAIRTDSRGPGEPKAVEGSALFDIYRAFGTDAETKAWREAFAQGIAWGDAKAQLFERIDREIAPMRGRYQALLADPSAIEMLLQRGAEKARAQARPFLAELRHAVGLRRIEAAAVGASDRLTKKAGKAGAPGFKQYREADGRFYFKLLDAQARLLVQSVGFASHQGAAALLGRLQREGAPAVVSNAAQLVVSPDVDSSDIDAALASFAGPTE